MKTTGECGANRTDDTPCDTFALSVTENPPFVRPSLSTAQDRTCIQTARFKRLRVLNTCLERRNSALKYWGQGS